MAPPPPDSDKARSAVRLRMLIGFGSLLALAAIVVFALATARNAAAERRQAEQWYVHTLGVLIVTSELKTAVNGAIRGERGYLLTGNPDFLAPYHEGRRAAPALAARIARMTPDNARQQQNLKALKPRLDAYLATLATAVRLEREGAHDAAVDIVRRGIGRNRAEAVIATVNQIEAEEHRLLSQRRALQVRYRDRLEQLDQALIALGALFVLVVAGVGASAARASRRAEHAVRELRRMATTDMLTGLANRRHFLTLLETEIARASRSGRPLSLAVLDVDHFKRINDHHGHPAGDAVLRAIAESLRRATRAGDLVGRLGGEEFAIMMPEASRDQASLASERIRRAVEGNRIVLEDGGELAVTLSVGVAVLEAEEGVDQLISRADKALYAAKQAGRNLVKLAA